MAGNWLSSAGRAFMNMHQFSMLNRELSLYRKQTTTTVVNGQPIRSHNKTLHWQGIGSFQPARLGRLAVNAQPKPFDKGELRDMISTAYLPYDAMPEKDMIMILENGDEFLIERKPNHVAGLSQHWQIYFIEAHESESQDA